MRLDLSISKMWFRTAILGLLAVAIMFLGKLAASLSEGLSRMPRSNVLVVQSLDVLVFPVQGPTPGELDLKSVPKPVI